MLSTGLDILIILELGGDLYFGEPRGISLDRIGQRVGINTRRHTEAEIARVAVVAFKTARRRSRKLTSVDKSNVLEAMVIYKNKTGETLPCRPGHRA